MWRHMQRTPFLLAASPSKGCHNAVPHPIATLYLLMRCLQVELQCVLPEYPTSQRMIAG